MEHPSYSHDLTLNDFWLFQGIKSALKGRRYQDTEDIQKNVMTTLKAIPQQEFQKCFQQWQHHWAKCTAAQEEYFKGDPLSVSCKYKGMCANHSGDFMATYLGHTELFLSAIECTWC
jgi:hypothetical protein